MFAQQLVGVMFEFFAVNLILLLWQYQIDLECLII